MPIHPIVVITGSTRGIGYALASEFARRECEVVVSGRTREAVAHAIETLCLSTSREHLEGYPCDVRRFEDLQRLWDQAAVRFGRVDIWINNAGIAHPQRSSWEQAEETIQTVIETNLLGALFGSKVAVRGMLRQGHGALYNVEGLGSDGRKVRGLNYYGTSKYGLHYFNECLAEELRGTNLLFGTIRPGMVITDMVRDQYQGQELAWRRNQRIFRAIASPVETVASTLAGRILENRKSGVVIRHGSAPRLMWRMMTLPFHRETESEIGDRGVGGSPSGST